MNGREPVAVDRIDPSDVIAFLEPTCMPIYLFIYLSLFFYKWNTV